MDRADALALAGAIVDVARELARSVPPPRGAPYFYLDTHASYDLRVLDALSTRGIFRKYEFALDLGSGLGGRARWQAARSGCRVVGVDARPHVVTAARILNERARMDEQVAFQVGCLDRLPLRARVFTHVWIVDAADAAVQLEMLAEAFRVLRPGAHFALQSAPLSRARRSEMLEMLRQVGFIEPETREASLADVPDACRVAVDRLSAAPSRVQHAWKEIGAPPRPAACLQIFARRPA